MEGFTGRKVWIKEVLAKEKKGLFQARSTSLGERNGRNFYQGVYLISTSTSVCVCVCVPQWCPTLCDPMNCGQPGSSIHGILQARILERDAIPFFRGSSQQRDGTHVSHTADKFFTI